jgi:hypothetical protein
MNLYPSMGVDMHESPLTVPAVGAAYEGWVPAADCAVGGRHAEGGAPSVCHAASLPSI